jgi:protocatechuate 3,4-dioxygenase beta subunit
MRKLMMLSLLVAGLSVGFAPLSAGAQAPTGKASIKGKVVGADGKPAAGVAVRLMHKEDKAATHKGAEPKTTAPAAKGKAAKGKGAAASPKAEAVAETTADAKGEFSFAGVAPGTYVVAARQKGVGNGREQVTVSGDGASNVTVKLKAEKGKGKAADSQARANHKHVKKAAVS